MTKMTILLVDGDAPYRESMRHILRSEGYRVLEAADYRGARNACQQHSGEINLLLTAIALPGGNGYELAKELQETDAGMKVLFVSGEAGAKVGQFYTRPWKDAPTLRRPFESAKLVERVKEVLNPPPKSSTAFAF